MINLKSYDLSQIKKIYESTFETENGQIILEDLKRQILETSPFSNQDTTTDALLREGARELLTFILDQVTVNDK